MKDSRFSRERIAQLSPKRLTLLALELEDQLAAEKRRGRNSPRTPSPKLWSFRTTSSTV